MSVRRGAAHLPGMTTRTRTSGSRIKGTIQTIAVESYDAEMAARDASLAHTDRLREQAEQARIDPALQCHHGVSLFADCAPCAVEVGDPIPGPGSTSMAALLGVPA